MNSKAQLDGVSQAVVATLERKGGYLTLGGLVDEVASRTGFRRHEIARSIHKLREIGMLDILDPRPPTSAMGFLFSTRAAWFWLLALAVVLAGVSVYVLPHVTPFNYARYSLGSLFVLYLPGASLVEFLFPKREHLSQLSRVALSIGMSLVAVPLNGLLLNYTPWGISLETTAISLGLLTVLLALGAILRKHRDLKHSFESARSP